MKVLFVIRTDAAERPGGDVVHAEHTAAALRELGVHVDVAGTLSPDASGYDVAHVWGVFEPEHAARQLSALREQRVPVALSPILMDLTEFLVITPRIERALGSDDPRVTARRFERLKRRSPFRFWRSKTERDGARRRTIQAALLRQADVLIPASETEGQLYAETFGSSLPFVVAHVGVDEQAFISKNEVRAGLLCAGRIESRKNQAALLYALRDVDIDITLAGRAYDEYYMKLCRRWATPRTKFLAHMTHAEIFALMSRTAVHVLPSWCETPGLASLEAAAAGAQIVVGNRGSEFDYFGSHAEYADPTDPASIREAVLRALARGARSSHDAFESQLRTFTWRRAAQATVEAYRLALAKSVRPARSR